MSEYMLLLLFSLSIPLILSFWPPLKFYTNLKPLVLSISLITFIFGLWDIFATYRGHWQFASERVWPLRIINLPLEEVFFFVAISFCCIFTWEAINYIRKRLR